MIAGTTAPGRRNRRLFVRVLAVQAVTLLALWALQSCYGLT